MIDKPKTRSRSLTGKPVLQSKEEAYALWEEASRETLALMAEVSSVMPNRTFLRLPAREQWDWLERYDAVDRRSSTASIRAATGLVVLSDFIRNDIEHGEQKARVSRFVAALQRRKAG